MNLFLVNYCEFCEGELSDPVDVEQPSTIAICNSCLEKIMS